MSRILVVAGEVSGDMRAAEVIEAVNAMRPGLEWFGIGGPRMRAAGVRTHQDIREMAVIGFAEVARRYPFFRRVFNDMVARAAAARPDLALLVDYPGFNLRLARKLHGLGIRTLFYICPQVWAWHRSRIPDMARVLDHMMTIFPFEADYFRNTRLPVTYVGHPLVDGIRRFLETPETPLPWKGIQRIALLPGSRTQELERLLPVMLDAAALTGKRLPGCGFIVAAAGEAGAAQARRMLEARGMPGNVSVISGYTREIVRQADAAMVCSGTATLETALLGCPMVVAYKTSPLTYAIFKSLIRIPHIGMVNIVAGRAICPECIQRAATPQRLADAVAPLVTPTPERAAMLEELRGVRQRMGEGGAAERAADVVLGMLNAPGRPA